MKKIIIFALSLIGFSLMSFVSLENGKLTLEKKWKLTYTLEFSCGHPWSLCGGYGERCPGINDLIYCHIPCWGAGTDCQHSVQIELGFKPSTGVVEEVSMDLINEADVEVLNMPSRSFEILDDNSQTVYLNIPAQTVQVDNFNPSNNTIYAMQNFTVTAAPTYQ
jgi:hypothetical protein